VLDVVIGENFPAGRSIQIGVTSGAQTHTVFGRNEPFDTKTYSLEVREQSTPHRLDTEQKVSNNA
jgi:hypothetical protein